MVNVALRAALDDLGITERELAEKVRVDPATVSRWISDEHRTPQLRIRAAVAEVLGADEMTLWPRAARSLVKTGPDREVVRVYPSRSAMPREVRQRLVADADRELLFVVYTGYSLWADVPDFSAVLRAKTEAGVRVRFVLGDPGAELTRLTDAAESTPMTLGVRIGHTLEQLRPLAGVVEVRQSTLAWGRGVTVGDGEMILTLPVLGRTGTDAPRLHLRRRQDGGLWDAMAAHGESVWAAAEPVAWPV